MISARVSGNSPTLFEANASYGGSVIVLPEAPDTVAERKGSVDGVSRQADPHF